MSHSESIKVAIVAHSCLLRQSLSGLLKGNKGVSVTSSVTASDCIRVPALSPDVVLLQHDHANTAPIRELTSDSTGMKLIVIEAVPAELDVVGCLKCGVAGFTLKDTSVEDLVTTIHAVAVGARVMPQPVTDRLCTQLSQIGKKSNRDLWMDMDDLTLRERQVVQFMLDGLSNKEIASQMNISTFTVKSHVHNILNKLNISSRIHLLNYWSRREYPNVVPA